MYSVQQDICQKLQFETTHENSRPGQSTSSIAQAKSKCSARAMPQEAQGGYLQAGFHQIAQQGSSIQSQKEYKD